MRDLGTPQQRLAHVLRRVRVPDGIPIPLASDSNDTWRIGSVVLRVCWRGDRDRFARETAVTAALPASVPYPDVLAADRDDHLAWQVTRAIDGVSLSQVWSGLSTEHRRGAIRQTGQLLAALNAHPFPAEVTALLAEPRPVDTYSVQALLGADVNPLPCRRALLLIGPARALPHVDRQLVDALEACLRSFADVDPLLPPTGGRAGPGPACVHADAHRHNVLWWDGRVVALLDFEWARLGPPDLELEPYLREIPAEGSEDEATTRDILGWLAEAHPAAFEPPDLIARLWLYQIGFALRQLLIWPPDRATADLPDQHPLRRLRLLVDGRSHLHRVLPDARR